MQSKLSSQTLFMAKSQEWSLSPFKVLEESTRFHKVMDQELLNLLEIMVVLSSQMRSKLVSVESVKNSGDTDGQVSSLILLHWPKAWVMVSQWLVLLQERKLWNNIKQYFSIHSVVDICNALLVCRFWKQLETKTFI